MPNRFFDKGAKAIKRRKKKKNAFLVNGAGELGHPQSNDILTPQILHKNELKIKHKVKWKE